MKTRAATALVLALTLIVPMLVSACAAKTVRDTTDDATITARVKTALLNDPDVGALRIDVDTFKGVVTLSGRVKSPAEEAKAMAVARTIKGVSDVKSSLQVQQ